MNEDSPGVPDPLISLFLELARIPSPTGRERPVVDFITGWLGELGLEVEEGEPVDGNELSAGNLYCRLPGSTGGIPVLFSAHTDTVLSEPGARPDPVIEDGVIRSGSRAVLGADNKAAVAAMLCALEKVVREGIPHAGIELLLTVCEESGLRGAKAASLEGIRAECGFCMDCTGPVGSIVVRSPSQKTIRAQFIGEAAHAGVAPEEGRSAIRAAAKAVSAMELGRLDGETTANIGTIKGGDAINIVPASCRIEGEARSHDAARLEETVASMLEAITVAAGEEGIDVKTSVTDEFSGFDFSHGGLPVELAERAIRSMGIKVDHISTGGGSDVNELNRKGLQCVNLAIGMEKLHTPDEYITVESLQLAHRLALEIIREAAG